MQLNLANVLSLSPYFAGLGVTEDIARRALLVRLKKRNAAVAEDGWEFEYERAVQEEFGAFEYRPRGPGTEVVLYSVMGAMLADALMDRIIDGLSIKEKT